LMIVHTPAMSWIARPAARGLVPASMYFSHGLPFAPEQGRIPHLVFRYIEKFMARYTDAIIVMNSDDVAACRKFKLTRSERQWYYAPGVGVDVDMYVTRPAEHLMTSLEQELGLTAGKPTVLFLGRFIRPKRPGDVLKLAQRIGSKADFVLAGEVPLWKQTRQAAARIGPHIKVIEFTHLVVPLLARCSLVVLPSVFREGMPRVLLESYAAGKPAVAYDVRGVRDIIENGKTGFLVRPGDVDELCKAVSNLLGDDQLRVRMGIEGQKRIRAKFSLDASLSAIMPAVREVLKQKVIWDMDRQ
jgi:glycosyltransferase involved in cell wall biosynthesis